MNYMYLGNKCWLCQNTMKVDGININIKYCDYDSNHYIQFKNNKLYHLFKHFGNKRFFYYYSNGNFHYRNGEIKHRDNIANYNNIDDFIKFMCDFINKFDENIIFI